MSIQGGVGAGGQGAINGPGGTLFIGPKRDDPRVTPPIIGQIPGSGIDPTADNRIFGPNRGGSASDTPDMPYVPPRQGQDRIGGTKVIPPSNNPPKNVG